ncbi:MAG: aminotransferase class V-fold PLP-dependent enzyme [Zetaproteobacteria bacterium]|nr:aminotransferase class V-fold PLP-dependent enzyme [Zetaproteobacteria bacterium]
MTEHLDYEFPLQSGLVYLNHAAVGVWSRRTAEAVHTFADENMFQGATDYPKWMKVEQSLRQQLTELIHAESIDDIALLKNTSEGLSIVAYGMDWHIGDNLVISNQEFPSNRIVWQSLKSQGVEVRIADIACDDPEAAMLACCDANTRLLSVSSVQYGTGLRMDLQRLGEACQQHGIFFCVDAIQSLGALDMDVQAIHADAVIADAHKWLLGPEGLAVFYISPAWRERLKLHQFGWHMIEDIGNFDATSWQAATSARRFEAGSPNMLGIHALHASLALLLEIGMSNIERMVLERTSALIDMVLEDKQLELVSPSQWQRCSGIVTFRFKTMNHQEHIMLYQQLMQKRVICAYRAGGIRFAPHFYTPYACFDEAWSRMIACYNA